MVTNYGIEQGLPLNAVKNVVQDADGFLYLATDEGLVRYDGYRMQSFNSSSNASFTNNRVREILYDGNQILWVHLRNYELAIFDVHKQELRPINAEFNTVYSFFEPVNGILVVRTELGYFIYRHEMQEFEKIFSPIERESVIGIDVISAQEIYFTTESGLWHVSSGNHVLIPMELAHLASEGHHVLNVFPENNHVWISSIHGQHLFRLSDGLHLHTESTEFGEGSKVGYLPGYGYILVFERGLIMYDKATGESAIISFNHDYYVTGNRYTLTSRGDLVKLGDKSIWINDTEVSGIDAPSAVFADDENNVWVSSQTMGLYKVSRVYIENITGDNYTPISNIYSMLESRSNPGEIWAASYGNGLYRIKDGATQVWNTRNSNVKNNFAWYVFEDRNGGMYASFQEEPLMKLDENESWAPVNMGSQLDFRYNSLVYAMYQHPKTDDLYAGRLDGLLVRQNGKWRMINEKEGLSYSGIRAFREHPQGYLIAVSNGNGIFALDDELNVKWALSTTDGLNSNFVRDVFVQSADTLWVVTENMGLNRVVFSHDEVVQIRSLTTREGLTHNGTHRMLVDSEDRVWLSSNFGIMTTSLLNLNKAIDEAHFPVQFIKITDRSGLINREANGGVDNAGFIDSEGMIVFPNQRGITRINANAFHDNLDTRLPTPVIEGLVFQDGTFGRFDQGNIRLPKGQRTFEIKYSAPNYSMENSVLVAFKMVGIDTDWQVAKDFYLARYTELRPGTYQFIVQARRIDGGVESATVQLIIPHYFYETRIFQVLAILMALLIIGALVKYRERQQMRLDRVQELVKKQTSQIERISEEKTRFFAGISHDIRQPLTMVIGPLEILMNSDRFTSDEFIRHNVGMIHRNANKILDLMNQMQEVVLLEGSDKPLITKEVDIQICTQDIVNNLLNQAKFADFPLHIDVDKTKLFACLDTSAWERIVINLVENAYEHAFSTKGMTISFSATDDEIMVKFCDYGSGIEEHFLPFLFEYKQKGVSSKGSGLGLYLVNALIKWLKGNVSVSSRRGEGTVFTVTVPRVMFVSTDTEEDNTDNDCSLAFEIDTASEKLRIMIVDDNNVYADFLESLLGDMYDVHVSYDSLLALDVVSKFVPELIISDVNMPGMDGYELIEKIRSIDQYNAIPVIFLSGNSHHRFVRKGLSSGADVYLTKPVNSEVLYSQIGALARREKILAKDPQLIPASLHVSSLVSKVTELVYRQLGDEKLGPEMIADALHMSRATLYREWKKESPLTLKKYIMKIRMQEAHSLINTEDFSLKTAAVAVGIKDVNYFAKLYRKEFSNSQSVTKRKKKIGT